MDKYQIGTRLFGEPRNYIKDLALTIKDRFYNEKFSEKIVPHKTYIRPFTTNNENDLIENFEETLFKFDRPLTYRINGFGTFEKPVKTVYVHIEQNPKINDLIKNLETNLERKVNYLSKKASSPEDKNKINLHSTIVTKIPDEYFLEIKNFIKNQEFNPVEHPLFRVYLLKNNFILREYDFSLKKSLNQQKAKMTYVFDETKKKFSELSGLILSESGMVVGKRF